MWWVFLSARSLRSHGQGGMILDPLRSGFPRSGIDPSSGIPDILPPGAVPPGARFDPFGPIGRRRPGWDMHTHRSLCLSFKEKVNISQVLQRRPCPRRKSKGDFYCDTNASDAAQHSVKSVFLDNTHSVAYVFLLDHRFMMHVMMMTTTLCMCVSRPDPDHMPPPGYDDLFM